MRITNKVLTSSYLKNINRNLQDMNQLEDQLSSGKLIRKPSDSPYDVARSMEINSSINRNSQYKRNIDDAQSWIDMTDEALGQIGDYMQRVSTIVNAAANGTNSDSEFYSYKTEIEQIAGGIIDAGNTNLNGKYIFGGHKTIQPPFEKGAVNPIAYVGEDGSAASDKGLIMREISPKVSIDINVTGDRIMNSGTLELGTLINNILGAMNDASKDKLSGYLGDINQLRDNILNIRAEVGARSNRIDAAAANNDTYDYNMTKVMSKVEDIDIAQKTMDVKVAEAVYTSSLMVGAKILQPSLLNFLG